MYNKVVVPLDGSDLAEVVLPHVQEIASGCSIPTIWLVSVTERVSGIVNRSAAPVELPALEGHTPPPTGPMHVGSTFSGLLFADDPTILKNAPASLGKMAKTALTYLRGVANKLEKAGLNAQAAVLVGNPAEEIVRFATQEKADLIVMASRGKSGFNRWDMGNVADKVIRATDIPVFLVKPKPGFKETKPKRRGKAT
jgi:nucleotide-binding universal stress UspA family protein